MRFYVQTNTFHCFGCQAGTSVFEFVMRMEHIDFAAALHKLAEQVGYSGTYSVHDLNIKSVEDSFIVVREKIELEAHRKAKQVFTYLQNIGTPLPILYKNFEILWEWYDKNQYFLDKKVFNGNTSNELKGILYIFYEEFLKKLKKTENICLKT